MKFMLKDFQRPAVDALRDSVLKAGRRYRVDDELSSVGLSAIMGAGKTVMAAATLEALLIGDVENGVDADETAVVLWLSDDPSLNEQSMDKIGQAAPKLRGRMRILSAECKAGFFQGSLSQGSVNFINTQKFSANSRMMNRKVTTARTLFDANDPTILDAVTATIDDPNKTLYMVIDEAHRGTDPGNSAPTIVSKLINGDRDWGNPPMPVVIGLSATLGKFSDAMTHAAKRTAMPKVTVAAEDVQRSGLLKLKLNLGGKGSDEENFAGLSYDSILLRRASQRLNASTAEWERYVEVEQLAEPVIPLMVLQVEDKTEPGEMARYISLLSEYVVDFDPRSVVHVLDDHTSLSFGPYSIEYMAPQFINDDPQIRFVITKTAIIEGWDCPRAEVLVSLRSQKSQTTITQSIGRILRTPLARTIPGNDLLNSAYCALPFYDDDAVEQVQKMISSGAAFDSSERKKGTGLTVLIEPEQVYRNHRVPKEVFEIMSGLPTAVASRIVDRPVRRFMDLAGLLEDNGLRDHAHAECIRLLCQQLDGAVASNADVVDATVNKLSRLRTTETTIDMVDRTSRVEEQETAADSRTIEEAFLRAANHFSRPLASEYCRYYLARNSNETMSEADKYPIEVMARKRLAALVDIPSVLPEIEDYSRRKVVEWHETARTQIKKLSDIEREEYRRVLLTDDRAMNLVDLVAPGNAEVPQHRRTANGKSKTKLPRRPKHVLAGSDDLFPIDLTKSAWEKNVLARELADDDVCGWYRNPVGGETSLGVPYTFAEEQRILYPDFLFFIRRFDGSIGTAIIDPHWTNAADSLPKLRGLAAYAEEYPDLFFRIESIAEIGNKRRTLDMTDQATRDAVNTWSKSLDELYLEHGHPY